MPLVIVRYDSFLHPQGSSPFSIDTRSIFEERFLKPLGEKLPVIVAGALNTLNTPEGRLKAGDIAVSFQPTSYFDRNTIAFSILVLANDVPERRQNLEERKQMILETLEKAIDWGYGHTFSVWVLLAPGAYGISLSSSHVGEAKRAKS